MSGERTSSELTASNCREVDSAGGAAATALLTYERLTALITLGAFFFHLRLKGIRMLRLPHLEIH